MGKKRFPSLRASTSQSARASSVRGSCASVSRRRSIRTWPSGSKDKCRARWARVLERLEIADFAVARQVVLEPGPGLTVFTGETGAGKSLVVDALAFVFGARRGREVIATGAERATVRAYVVLAGERRVLERTIALSGRTSAKIDDAPATVEDLRALADGFIDIHGQSEQLSILKPAVQLAVLDEFAGLGREREGVAELVRELRDIRRRFA